MQGNEIRHFDLTPYVSLLKLGVNTLAVEIGNVWSDYDDIAFDVSLKAVLFRPSIPKLTVQHSGQATQLAAETPPGTIWRLESCDNLAQPNWQVIQVFTNVTGGISTVLNSITGLRGFYRLVPY